MRAEAETRAQHEKTIEHLAGDAFKNHTLTSEGDGRWFCKGKDSFYWFRVVALPGALLVTGDIDTTYFEMSDRDPIKWIRGCIKSKDYVLGKVRAAPCLSPARAWDPRKQFFPGDAFRYIAEEIAQAKKDEEEGFGRSVKTLERLGKVRRDFLQATKWDDGPGLYIKWAEIWHDHGATTDDYSNCDGWNSTLLWHYHALVKFCELLDAQETV